MHRQRQYYEAYEDRYCQVHKENLRWFSEEPSSIVAQIMREYQITPDKKLLEVGCGEGRDALYLLKCGYNVLASDISPEAIRFCREENPGFAEHFQVLNCITDSLEDRFDFIFAVAVIHMLVSHQDRTGFYQFVRRQLSDTGIALICTMGDGEQELCSDISKAFDLQERIHEQTGKRVYIAGTSCRIVSFASFRKELAAGGLKILKEGVTAVEPDFPQMMYAVVCRQ